MKILDTLARQSKASIWVAALIALFVIAVADYVTPWQFRFFMFYSLVIFVMSWVLGLRAAVIFALISLSVSWLANINTSPAYDLRTFLWSMANRSVGFIFAAACGTTLRSYRMEAQGRVQAMERSRQLEREIVRTGEAEQRRIGRDLHDGVCQSLSAICCATEVLKRDLEETAQEHVENADEIQRMLREAILELRSLARSMYPVNLTGEGLSAALESLVTGMSRLRQAEVVFYSEGDIEIDDAAAAIHLYRITQEALSNAMKHAHARRIVVRLKRGDGWLRLTVTDNGRGLPSGVEDSTGMGLHTMEYRANLIGAKLSVEPAEGGGVRVSCLLPMKNSGSKSAIMRKPEPAAAAAVA